MFNIKKIIKWFFIILGVLLFLLIGFFVLTEMNIIKLPKEKIPILKETKFENIDEWYDGNNKCQMIKAKYTFDGLNGIGYYQQQLANKDNINFYELGNIKNRLENQKEPSNLANYIKDRYPFDRWNNRGLTYEETSINGFKFSRFDIGFYSYLENYVNLEKQFKEDSSGNCLILKYKGPKHLLDADKDYYLGCAWLENSEFNNENFHLHFNPVRKTLSLYQDKHNNDKVQEAEYNKRTSSDW
ncbi:ATP-dependent Zn protease [Candidatus Phytoplasma rubi]|uniref:ATP-dependent Zn protease n=1 Tax=Candidatus Phytoplasma rubi TaxID=399025 RepID=A0ABY7BT02_9MOLU|nr:effector [Candidatus Phytoplasma rubi]WAN63447.1 ATP-dependent Zn protease [Candidatus Phytoplasma rubi]